MFCVIMAKHSALLDKTRKRTVAGAGRCLLRSPRGWQICDAKFPGEASAEARKSPNSIGLNFVQMPPGDLIVGDARFGGNAGPRKGDQARRIGDHSLQVLDLTHSSAPVRCCSAKSGILTDHRGTLFGDHDGWCIGVGRWSPSA